MQHRHVMQKLDGGQALSPRVVHAVPHTICKEVK
jgi:hypothetical protein